MKTKLNIPDIMCAACVSNVEKGLSKLEGIKEVHINLLLKEASVDFDEKLTSEDGILQRLKAIGYPGELKKDAKEVKVQITGMSCAACALTVQKALENNPKVNTASVNELTHEARIIYEGELSAEEIQEAVEKAGYEVSFSKEKVAKEKKNILPVAIVLTVAVFILAMAPMVGIKFPEFIDPMISPRTNSLVQVLLVLPVVIIGKGFYVRGYKSMFRLSPNMDSLIALSTTAALGYSLFYMIEIWRGNPHGIHHLYFESVAMIITLIMFGKFLEERAKKKTTSSVEALMGLAPDETIRIVDGKEETVLTSQIRQGDILRIRGGDRIPVDAVILEGMASIDESMLTGESISVSKTTGDRVFTGSMNERGPLLVEAKEVGKNTLLSKIIAIVEEAQSQKAPIARLADKVSGIFVPVVMGIAIISSVLWYISKGDIGFSLSVFVSVLVIACPCALGLATPTAIMVGTGKAAEMGILIKGAQSLEEAHKITHVVFDKTGTLTKGEPVVTDVVVLGDVSKEELILYSASLEAGSSHPLGKAISALTKERVEVKEIRDEVGKGITGKIGTKTIALGSEKLIPEAGKYLREDVARVFVAIDDKPAGYFEVEDEVKETSIKAVEDLHKMGLKVIMLTGDREPIAKRVGEKVGIDQIIAGVFPTDKSKAIEDLKGEGRVVAMVGDGINDSPALAASDVSIAMGTGTDIAMETADIVLVKRNLQKVRDAILLSKYVIGNIKQNLFWAFIYNIIGIPIAAGALYLAGGPLLNPMIGALAMSLSSVSVVSNALRLKGKKVKL